MLYERGCLEVQSDTDYGGEDEETRIGREEGEVKGSGWAILNIEIRHARR